jgi:hypothetical protein
VQQNMRILQVFPQCRLGILGMLVMMIIVMHIEMLLEVLLLRWLQLPRRGLLLVSGIEMRL